MTLTLCRDKLRVLDLFSGIGGFSLGLERAGMQTVCFVEIDPFCQKVLRKHWPNVPIIPDIKGVTIERLREVITNTKSEQTQSSEQRGLHAEPCGEDSRDTAINLICGGFPCQPFSCAGKRKGTADDRYLWPEMLRVISEVHPTWVIAENVGGLYSQQDGMVFGQVLSDLETQGYEVQPFLIPACAVNAPHRRDRFWIVANTEHDTTTRYGQDGGGTLPVTEPIRLNNCNQWDENWYSVALRTCVRGVHDGVSDRVHRLKALGNSIVPQIAEIIGRAIMEVDQCK